MSKHDKDHDHHDQDLDYDDWMNGDLGCYCDDEDRADLADQSIQMFLQVLESAGPYDSLDALLDEKDGKCLFDKLFDKCLDAVDRAYERFDLELIVEPMIEPEPEVKAKKSEKKAAKKPKK